MGIHRESATSGPNHGEPFDFDALLHPGGAFARPADVVRDADLTLNEKRALLASWASESCAEDAAPQRRAAADGRTIPFDEVMDALREIDRQSVSFTPPPRYRRVLENRIPGVFGRDPDHRTSPPR